ncbi:hypothetical protein Q0O86_13910, partial [Staphylococcus aureus]|nr:hypothetical protein [Staphylococcus aureus]
MKKTVCLNAWTCQPRKNEHDVLDVHRCAQAHTYKHFPDEVARREAEDEADEHAGEDGDDRLMDGTDTLDLEV